MTDSKVLVLWEYAWHARKEAKKVLDNVTFFMYILLQTTREN
jgi:hypothetical protein